MKNNFKVGIIGTGSWGLALAKVFSQKNKVSLFFNTKKNFDELNKNRASRFLPGIKFSKDIFLSLDLNDLGLCDAIFIVVPTQQFRENMQNLKESKITPKNLILCSKGIEIKTNCLMSEISGEFFPKVETMVLSGPNFANEVALGLPTAYVLSGKNKGKLKEIATFISNKTFRPYFNTDVIGTQLGGAVKNIIAIACGIVVGKKLGENARSSILTRGLQELVYLGKKMGAKKDTFFGLSGIGDLNLSCSSINSRNFSFGVKLGEGMNIKKLQKENYLVEGFHSCNAVIELAEKYKIDMPITKAVKQVISGEKISDVVNKLLSRPFQFEE